jgi:hypothetical protein
MKVNKRLRAKIKRIAKDNPDLPIPFIKGILEGVQAIKKGSKYDYSKETGLSGIPNKETIKAMQDAKAGKTHKAKNVRDLFKKFGVEN